MIIYYDFSTAHCFTFQYVLNPFGQRVLFNLAVPRIEECKIIKCVESNRWQLPPSDAEISSLFEPVRFLSPINFKLVLEYWSYLFHDAQQSLALFHDSRILALKVYEQHHHRHR